MMSLSRCSSWPKLSLHNSEINNIMYAEKTLYWTVDDTGTSVDLHVIRGELDRLTGELRVEMLKIVF